uniref:Uncharacterized protein n=1 Tax=Romanomermis culicivorax TaxID=13658 RepID=A0A915JSU4_ROMCU
YHPNHEAHGHNTKSSHSEKHAAGPSINRECINCTEYQCGGHQSQMGAQGDAAKKFADFVIVNHLRGETSDGRLA